MNRIVATHPEARDWLVCGDLEVNPVHASPMARGEPKKVVFLFEGNSGYSRKRAIAARREMAKKDAKPGDVLLGMSKTPSGTIAGSVLLDAFVIDLLLRDNLTDDSIYWLYYSFLDADRASRCAAKIAQIPSVSSMPVYSTIAAIGFSNGGPTALSFARNLQKYRIFVDHVITLDPVKSPHSVIFTLGIASFFPLTKPANVGYWSNYYQRKSPYMRGRRSPNADSARLIEDPASTHSMLPSLAMSYVSDDLRIIEDTRSSYLWNERIEDARTEKEEEIPDIQSAY